MAHIITKSKALYRKYLRYKILSIVIFFISIIFLITFIVSLSKRNSVVLFASVTGGMIAIIIFTVTFRRSNSLSAGIAGENKAYRVLSELDDSYYVFRNLIVEYEDKKSEIDIVVIGPTGVFVVETKNIKGRISGDYSNKTWLQRKNHREKAGFSREFYNPIKQVSTHTYRLAKYFRNYGFYVDIRSIVYFSNSETRLYVTNRKENIPIFSEGQNGSDKLISYIKNSARIFNNTTVTRIALLLQEGQA